MSLSKAFKTTIGAKTLMALTGLALLGFVLVHMLGNLQIFLGRDALNGYAAQLQSLGGLLWVARGGLLAVLVVHVAMAIRLTRANRMARPVAYVSAQPQVTCYAARTMLMSGLIVLAFAAYHLLHFTLGVTHPQHHALTTVLGGKTVHDVYSMVVLGFREVPVALGYLVAQALLALHLSHGASSLFQSLGVTHPTLKALQSRAGPALALLIFAGNASIVLACWLGWVKLPEGIAS
ncbi:MAG: succinate dehydrogenase cytochrome b subunit [Planctomycetia bacterium]